MKESSGSNPRAKSRLVLLGLLSGMACFISPSWAVRFLVAPPRFELTIPSGGASTQAIEVTNADEKPVKLKAYPSDWTLGSSGEMNYQKSGTQTHSCSNWLTINPMEFTIPAQGTQVVRFTLKAPLGASGGYWTVVFFESAPEPRPGERVGMLFNARVGSIVYATIAGTATKSGKIAGLKVGKPSPGKPLAVTALFQNSGSVPLRPKGKLEVFDSQGKRLGTADIPETAVLPESSREIQTLYSGTLAKGTLRITVTLDYGGSEILAGETTFENK